MTIDLGCDRPGLWTENPRIRAVFVNIPSLECDQPRFDEICEYGYLIPGLIHTKPPIHGYAKPRSMNPRVSISIFVRNSREYVTCCHALLSRSHSSSRPVLSGEEYLTLFAKADICT